MLNHLTGDWTKSRRILAIANMLVQYAGITKLEDKSVIRLNRVPRLAIRHAVGVALFASAVFGAFSPFGNASQIQSLSDGVYSTPQAERAQLIYQAQCAMCHGNALQGASEGSPLTGEGFLSNWSGQPLSDLVDKIENTMPFGAPGSLSRQQATDPTAYILQAGEFPAGRDDNPTPPWLYERRGRSAIRGRTAAEA